MHKLLCAPQMLTCTTSSMTLYYGVAHYLAISYVFVVQYGHSKSVLGCIAYHHQNAPANCQCHLVLARVLLVLVTSTCSLLWLVLTGLSSQY